MPFTTLCSSSRWKKTPAAVIRLAGPSCARTISAVSALKKRFSVGTPAARASSTTFEAGSTPQRRRPKGSYCRSHVPSLLPMSTTRS